MIETIGQIKDAVLNLIQDIIDAFVAVLSALQEFDGMLEEFDAKIVEMTNSCGSSEFTGMPIVDAIGMFRYLVGDLAFYMIYFTILFGCLMTIYKLVVLIYDALFNVKDNISGGYSKGFFGSILDKNIY